MSYKINCDVFVVLNAIVNTNTRMLQMSNYGNIDSKQISRVICSTMIMENYLSWKHCMTYCEHVHLNPINATGPDWNNIIPAKLHHIDLCDWKKIKNNQCDPLNQESFVCSNFIATVSKLCHGWWQRTTHILTHCQNGRRNLQSYLETSKAHIILHLAPIGNLP